MALIAGQLYPALYKGVRFLIQSHTLTAGRKTVTHEFPNSDIRVVEDLGALPDTFVITGITTGGNYKNDRDNLIAALNSPGPGLLVHPFFGTLEVSATTYTLNESTTQLNVAMFSMNFQQSQANVYPAFSGQNISLINRLAILIADLLNTDIANLFVVSNGYPQNFKDAVQLLTGCYLIFESINKPFNAVINTVAAYDEAVSEFNDDINSNISDPAQLSDDMKNIFLLNDQMATAPEDKFKLAIQFFGTNLNSPPIEPTTLQRVERINNRNIINQAMNLFSLLNGYNAFALTTYTRFDLLDSDFQTLENQYQYLINTYSPSGDTLDMLKDLRVEVRTAFDAQKINVRYLVPIIVKPNTLRNICYLLYGNTTDLQDLVNINNITNPARVSGELLVFSE